ncbi:MAG: DNA-binding protein [Gammaproteobacteria bacterium]|nr:MAG: DNA-binding protein [Gammaproteobacteria bacterium]
MRSMNEKSATLQLFDFMGGPDGWGRPRGREVFQELLRGIEEHPGTTVFRVSLKRVQRIDISFAAETVIELAKRYRKEKGFCLIDVDNEDQLEHWEAAAVKQSQPIFVWMDGKSRLIGLQPTKGTARALEFVIKREKATAAELASALKTPVNNASTKLKQLWEKGFLLRRQTVAASGGIEFVYFRIA